MRLFHGTDHQFDQFDLDHVVSGDGHNNGGLGIWLETREAIAGRFGSRLLIVEARFEKSYVMTIGELVKISSGPPPVEWFVAYRKTLAGKGFDSILLEEITGERHQVIALDPKRLEIVDVRHSS